MRPSRLVVLCSGAGTNLQALIDAGADPAYGATVVLVGADRAGTPALERAERHGIESFVHRVADCVDRPAWDRTLTERVAAAEPDLIVLAGFMKLVGPALLDRFAGRVVNTHPALSPSFPGMHGPAEALAYGVRLTGCTLFIVDPGVDTGPIVAQSAVPVDDEDSVESLHERIKVAERSMLVDTVGAMARGGYRIDGRRVRLG